MRTPFFRPGRQIPEYCGGFDVPGGCHGDWTCPLRLYGGRVCLCVSTLIYLDPFAFFVGGLSMSLFLSCLVSLSFPFGSFFLNFLSFFVFDLHFFSFPTFHCSLLLRLFLSLFLLNSCVSLTLSFLVHIPISLSTAFVPLSPVCLYFSLSLFLLFVYLANSGEEENNPNRFHSHVITRQEQYGVKKNGYPQISLTNVFDVNWCQLSSLLLFVKKI